MLQAGLLYTQSRTIEMLGDVTTDRQEQLSHYHEAMFYLKESEDVATDPATNVAYQRLQAKSNPKMRVVLDPATDSAACTPMDEEGVVLENLPRGPQHELPPPRDGPRFV